MGRKKIIIEPKFKINDHVKHLDFYGIVKNVIPQPKGRFKYKIEFNALESRTYWEHELEFE